MKKALILIESYGLLVMVVLLGASFVLAVGQMMGGGMSLWEALVEAVTGDPSDAKGWAKAMHVMFTVTVGWAAMRLYFAAVGLKWDNFAARRLLRGHVIIVAGRPGSLQRDAPEGRRSDVALADKSALAVDLALSIAETRPVVLHLPEAEEGRRAKLWKSGVRLLTGDMPMPEVLPAAGASRARLLIAMRDDAGENIVLARSAVSPALGNDELEVKCMLEPLEAKRRFRMADYFEAATLPRIRVFNESELIGRRILKDHPPDAVVALTARPVHLLLIGLGSVGQSVLLQQARMGHYRSGLKAKATVVDHDVKARWREMLKAHPSITNWLVVETEETRVEDVGDAELARWLADPHAVTMVYVCTSDEIANLRIARLLIRAQAEREASGGSTPAEVVALDPAGGSVLTDFSKHGAHEGRFHLFSLVAAGKAGVESPIAGSLLSEVDDRVAKQLHDDYCANDDRACAADPERERAAANKPWAELDETYRDANRSSADHLDVKLRAVGCKLVPVGTSAPAEFSGEEIEILARMEHDRWWADRQFDGWAYGKERDNAAKLHPSMVPYDDLSDAEKQKDRDNFANLRSILRRGGMEVVRA